MIDKKQYILLYENKTLSPFQTTLIYLIEEYLIFQTFYYYCCFVLLSFNILNIDFVNFNCCFDYFKSNVINYIFIINRKVC